MMFGCIQTHTQVQGLTGFYAWTGNRWGCVQLCVFWKWIWQSIHWNKQERRSSTLCHETGSSVLTAVSLSSVCRIPDKCSVISYCVLFFVHSVISIQEKFLKRIFACKIFFIVIRLLNKIQLWCSSGSFMMFHDYLENCNQEALRVFLLTLHFKAIRFTINFCKLSLF